MTAMTLTERLKQAVAAAHDRVESLPLTRAMFAGRLPRGVYLRLLAELEGERTLVRLYRRVDGATDVPRVFRRTTGTSLQEFTGEWRDLLQDLAA